MFQTFFLPGVVQKSHLLELHNTIVGLHDQTGTGEKRLISHGARRGPVTSTGQTGSFIIGSARASHRASSADAPRRQPRDREPTPRIQLPRASAAQMGSGMVPTVALSRLAKYGCSRASLATIRSCAAEDDGGRGRVVRFGQGRGHVWGGAERRGLVGAVRQGGSGTLGVYLSICAIRSRPASLRRSGCWITSAMERGATSGEHKQRWVRGASGSGGAKAERTPQVLWLPLGELRLEVGQLLHALPDALVRGAE